MQAQSGVELSVLGSWSLPKDGQEGMESFLRDLSTIFPQERWLQINRELGKTGFTCQVVHRDQSETLYSPCALCSPLVSVCNMKRINSTITFLCKLLMYC